MTACVLILGRFALQCPNILSYFSLQIWSQPILKIGNILEPKYFIPDINTQNSNSQILVNETNLSDCIELYHIICTCLPLNPNLIECFYHNGIIEVILDLTIFILMSAPLSNLRQLTLSICKELFLYGDSKKIITILEQIITFGWKNSYQITDSGGIEIIYGNMPSSSSSNDKLNLSSLISGTGIQISDLLGTSSLSSLSQEESENDYLSILREALLQQQSLFIDNESNGSENNNSTSLGTVQKVMERTRSICNLFLEITPEEEILENNTNNNNNKSNDTELQKSNSLPLIPSKLFLRMLRGYLGITSQDDVDEVYDSKLSSHVCGIIVLVMKSHISLDILLQDGNFIFLCLFLFYFYFTFF